jgi:hypothetical protein
MDDCYYIGYKKISSKKKNPINITYQTNIGW